jgi:hypothetical protein
MDIPIHFYSNLTILCPHFSWLDQFLGQDGLTLLARLLDQCHSRGPSADLVALPVLASIRALLNSTVSLWISGQIDSNICKRKELGLAILLRESPWPSFLPQWMVVLQFGMLNWLPFPVPLSNVHFRCWPQHFGPLLTTNWMAIPFCVFSADHSWQKQTIGNCAKQLKGHPKIGPNFMAIPQNIWSQPAVAAVCASSFTSTHLCPAGSF